MWPVLALARSLTFPGLVVAERGAERLTVAIQVTAFCGLSEETRPFCGRSPHHPSHSAVESRPFQPSERAENQQALAYTYLLYVIFDQYYLYVLRVFGRRIHPSNPGVWSKDSPIQSGCLVVQNCPDSQGFVEKPSRGAEEPKGAPSADDGRRRARPTARGSWGILKPDKKRVSLRSRFGESAVAQDVFHMVPGIVPAHVAPARQVRPLLFQLHPESQTVFGYSTRRSCAGAMRGAEGKTSSAPFTVR